MSVVKADAYGHGDVKVAQALQSVGCSSFAVSNIDEAITLRKAGVRGQILILGYTPLSAIDDLVEYDITQAILSEEYAQQLAGRGIKAQFAIDTGMNRIGLDADDVRQCEETIRKYSKLFYMNGIFTHLCVADAEDENEFTNDQIKKFQKVASSVVDVFINGIGEASFASINVWILFGMCYSNFENYISEVTDNEY